MSAQNDILLVGNSMRYLAQSARAAGFEVTAVDAFADQDTQLACSSSRKVDAASPHALSQAAREVCADSQRHWVYGAGFESDPTALVEMVQCNRSVLGNEPRVLQLLADPLRLFALLDELDIGYPEVCYDKPSDPSGWLFKPNARCGGVGVRLARSVVQPPSAGYYQRFVKGLLCSVVFAADGSTMEVIGVNRLYARFPEAGDFRFAGAVSGLTLAEAQRERVITAARRLTRALGLRGVNGLDFVIHKGEPLLLDVNARPPATLELYESSLPQGGFVCHLQACRGSLTGVQESDTVRGQHIAYARKSVRPGIVDWPRWVTDRPVSGIDVIQDQPLCTVHALGSDVESVTVELRQRIDAVADLVGRSSRIVA